MNDVFDNPLGGIYGEGHHERTKRVLVVATSRLKSDEYRQTLPNGVWRASRFVNGVETFNNRGSDEFEVHLVGDYTAHPDWDKLSSVIKQRGYSIKVVPTWLDLPEEEA